MWHPWRVVKAAYQVARSVQDPQRLEDIVELAGVLVPPQKLRRLTDTLWDSPSAAQALRERRRLGAVDVAALHTLPSGTLGRAFADHLAQNGLRILPEHAWPGTDAEYVRAHLLEVHDIWHVLTGFGTQVAGELGLQAFSLAQAGQSVRRGHPRRRPGQHPPVRLPRAGPAHALHRPRVALGKAGPGPCSGGAGRACGRGH